MGHVLLYYLSCHHYHQPNWSQILGQHSPPFLIFARCLWQKEFKGTIPNTVVTMKWHKHFLISPTTSSGKWTFYFPGLVRILPPTSQSRWAAKTRLGIFRNPSQVGTHMGASRIFFLATLDHLCLLFLWEHHIKQSLLCGSFCLLNHGLFFPQDITCYSRVSFQKVLSGLAQNWFCIKGKNQSQSFNQHINK